MAVALVTGAGRGIGAAAARSLAASGHQLVVVDVPGDIRAVSYPLGEQHQLDKVAAECNAVAVTGNAAETATIKAAVDAAIEHFGGLDIVVCAAGIMAGGAPLWEHDEDQWQIQLETNTLAPMRLAAVAIPAMLARPEPRRGRFIAIGSAAATKATPRLGAYAASKAALTAAVRSLAADLANTGITANVVAPGSTATDLLDFSASIYALEDPAEFGIHHIDQRLLDPAEIGSTISWLCSDGSSAINGSVIAVDAGMSAL